MLKSIRLVNFQAHIDTLIEMDKGITSLTGESHEGKTAVMRGLNWAVNNEPSGTGFISYWAKHKTKKGLTVLDLPCKVECIREDGQTLTRERSATFNGYKINGKNLGASGVGVPDEVKKWFNMGEVNIQSQHDSLFLLHSGGKGGQEVARFLNSVVKLDEIPRALSEIESRKRAVRKQKEAEVEKITAYEKTLMSLGWVTEVEPLFLRLQKIEDELKDWKTQEINIIEEIEQYDGLMGVLEVHSWAIKVSPLVERWDKIFSEELGNASFSDALYRSVLSFNANTDYLKLYTWVPEAAKVVFEIKEMEYELGMACLHKQNVEINVEKFETAALFLETNQPWLKSIADNMDQLEMVDHSLEELENKGIAIQTETYNYIKLGKCLRADKDKALALQKQLPDICPMCKGPWKGDKHENSR